MDPALHKALLRVYAPPPHTPVVLMDLTLGATSALPMYITRIRARHGAHDHAPDVMTQVLMQAGVPCKQAGCVCAHVDDWCDACVVLEE